ncbi:MAG: FAD-binding oxidoreductase, partial [Thermoanaerobaculia bacterium]
MNTALPSNASAFPGTFPELSRKLQEVVDLFAWPLHASDYLELVNPLWSTKTLRARIESVIQETPDARTLTLRPGRGWRTHRAGQHTRVGITLDGKHHVRTYSISSAPERRDGRITITVKAHPGGRVSGALARDLPP